MEQKKSLNSTQIAQNMEGIALNDIWALKKIRQQIPKKTSKQIVLEFNIKDKKFYGNDGCNQIFGALKRVTNTQIKFGLIAGTQMACKNMDISYEYVKGLENVRFYKRENLHLYLLDENKKEIFKFLKVD